MGAWRSPPAARSRRWLEARDEGLARAIGVTGHGLRIAAMHRRSLERFRLRLGAAAVQPCRAALEPGLPGREVEALLATVPCA